MASHRKKTTQKLEPLKPLENLVIPCVYQNGRVLLRSMADHDVAILSSHGYGKGTLSRGYPNFKERAAKGLIGATTEDPFAVPARFVNKAQLGDSTPSQSVEDTSELTESEESYQLSREEAMYLVEKLGILSISLTPDGDALSPSDLVDLFVKDQENFLYRYYAYNHYRSLGWVVKIGAKNGVDLLLYAKGGPVHVHAQYGVKIEILGKAPAALHKVPWQVSTRVLDTVAKELLIAIVTIPEAPQHGSQIQFENWSIDELTLNRWDVNESSKTS